MAINSKRILIAEDELSIAQALKLKLENMGYEVVVVNNGLSAINAATKESFDLLLLDIMMPDQNGFEVMKALQNEKVELPIIISSNLSQEIDKEKAKRLGALDFYVKSNTSLAEIVEKLGSYLGK